MVEMMIVVVIIGVLATIAIPSYNQYLSRARQSACMSEVKGYSNLVFSLLNDQEDKTTPVASNITACQSITNATGWTLETQQKIIATTKFTSNARIECDIPNGSPCRVLP